MDNLKIVEFPLHLVNKDLRNAITLLIDENNGLIFHEPCFIESVSHYSGCESFYYLVYNNDKLIAACPFFQQREKKFIYNYSSLTNYDVVYGGWVFNSNIISYEKLNSLIKLPSNQCLQIWSNFLINQPIYKSNYGIYYTSYLKLSNTKEIIWNNSIDSKRRNMIRKARKNNISIVSGKEALDPFLFMLHDLYLKLGFIRDINFHREIFNIYYDNRKANILLAHYDNKPIGGVFLIGNKNSMHYWLGVQKSNNNMNKGHGELLQWEAIKWSKNAGSTYYDLCYVISKKQLIDQDIKQKRIAEFKKGFSKELVPFYCINKKSFLFRVKNKLQNVFTN